MTKILLGLCPDLCFQNVGIAFKVINNVGLSLKEMQKHK
ncbi:hypothetical protein LEP1GSC037_5682 [Leptospira interrogans str. 2006001854]|uniref:Uncharacterized protein n=1 Tax=Leptospira interrogans str. 2006001854 TaxID=1001590 RepID=M6G8X4_LEPIR|nr:hypothetical protein LEP1GSC037_5682 [Leptospira interrogans str. 2006001854]